MQLLEILPSGSLYAISFIPDDGYIWCRTLQCWLAMRHKAFTLHEIKQLPVSPFWYDIANVLCSGTSKHGNLDLEDDSKHLECNESIGFEQLQLCFSCDERRPFFEYLGVEYEEKDG
jgi:hypothetical protein